MQRKIDHDIKLGKTASPFDSIGGASAIDLTASKFSNPKKKVQNIRKLIETGNMALTLMNIYVVLSSSCFKEYLKTLTLKSSRHIFPTNTWNI